MKANCLIIVATFCLIGMQCEYEVTQPAWYDDYTNPPTPSITAVEPAAAEAGCNYITITGENFSGKPVVYFDNVVADVQSNSKTELVVRRPNLVSDSSVVKVVCDSALVVAKYSPYRITKVLENYGNFLENTVLSVLAVDDAENLYVIDENKNIYKITPAGDKTVLTLDVALAYIPTDACWRNGSLFFLENNRPIEKVETNTGTKTRYVQLPAGKKGVFGDFDTLGYYYVGGTKTGLMVVTPSATSSTTTFYTADTIHAVQVFENYVYVCASAAGTTAPTIIRHRIDNGSVGAPDTVLAMSATDFAARKITGIIFASDGTLFIATDDENPLLVYNSETTELDYYYKGILPSYCKKIYWGSQNYLYMITGDTEAGADWTVYRVDMGTTGAP